MELIAYYECDECGFQSFVEDEMKAHVDTHEEEE